MTAQELRLQIKKLLIDTLKIADVEAEQIKDDEMLFESEMLGLDSLDGLELVMAIQKQFNVAINDQHHAVNILKTINSIAEFIEDQKQLNQ